MENEKDNLQTVQKSDEEIMLDFASNFSLRRESAASVDENAAESDFATQVMSVNMRAEVPTTDIDAPVRITDEEESDNANDESVFVRHEAESDPQPTQKQLRKAEKQAKKQEKWNKKDAKRNAKIDRQQKNNTKIMLGGAIFLAIVCGALLVMNHFGLTFVDIPDVLSGEKKLSTDTSTKPLLINEPTEAGPVAPPKGMYVVSSTDGVYLRESAMTDAKRLAVLDPDTTLTVSAFKYDTESECFWGRVNYEGMYGWVVMTALTIDETETQAPETTTEQPDESIG